MFQAHRDAQDARRDAEARAVVFGQTRMGGGRRMADQALGVAQIVRDIDQRQRIGDPERRVLAAFDLEGHQIAETRHLALRQLSLGMTGQARVPNALDLRLALQESRQVE